MTITFSSRAPASRFVLQAIAKACKDADFTELLRLHCKERRWEGENSRLVCVFVMESKAHYQRMLAALKTNFTTIQKLYAAEGDIQLSNLKCIYE